MIKTPNDHSIFKSSNGLVVRWKGPPFNLTLSFLWRGIYVPFNIKSFKTEFGETSTVSILYKRKVFARSMTKWKYSGGSHGDEFPDIETEHHKLSLRVRLNEFEVVDLQQGLEVDEDHMAHPFTIIYLS